MNNTSKQSRVLSLLVIIVLFVDQSIKVWIKTHLWLSQEIKILGQDWALIHFMENNGMAFGISLGGDFGKLALSIFRIIAIFFLLYLIRNLIRNDTRPGVLIPLALILAGAIGNMIDSAFYGMIFSDSGYFHGGVARFLPAEGGYAGFLHGKVVDMFHFPVLEGFWPDWVPVIGGHHYLFFKPVFNVADIAITLGVLQIILFQRSFFLHDQSLLNEPDANTAEHLEEE